MIEYLGISLCVLITLVALEMFMRFLYATVKVLGVFQLKKEVRKEVHEHLGKALGGFDELFKEIEKEKENKHE